MYIVFKIIKLQFTIYLTTKLRGVFVSVKLQTSSTEPKFIITFVYTADKDTADLCILLTFQA